MTRKPLRDPGPSAPADGPDYLAHLLVAVMAPLLVLAPPLRLLAVEGPSGAIRFFAADTFYYLNIANQSSDRIFTFTYDGFHPTNGFQPLWQYILALLVKLFNLEGRSALQLDLVLLISAVFVAAGVGLFALAVLRLTLSPALAMLAAVPGPYYLLSRPYGMGLHFDATWSFVNGMETPLSVLLFGTFFYWLVRADVLRRAPAPRSALLLGVLAALMFMTRLDDGAWLVPLAVWGASATSALPPRERLRMLGLLLGPAAACLVLYLLFNLAYCGMALPVSGMSKSGFALIENLKIFVGAFLPVTPLLEDPRYYVHLQWRAFQMFLPALAALALLARIMDRRKDGGFTINARPHTPILVLFSGYVAIKGLYNIAFVRHDHQGHWYFPVSIMIMNLGAALLLSRLEFRGRAAFRSRFAFIALLPVLVYWTALFTNLKQVDFNYQGNVARLWNEGQRLRGRLVESKQVKGLLEYDDGIVGFALEMPTMNGFGLTLDKEAVRAKRDYRLLELAHKRGFSAFASLNYPPAMKGESLKDPEALREDLKRYMHFKSEDNERHENLDAWDFTILLRDRPTGLVVIGFEPKKSG